MFCGIPIWGGRYFSTSAFLKLFELAFSCGSGQVCKLTFFPFHFRVKVYFDFNWRVFSLKAFFGLLTHTLNSLFSI